MSIQIFYEDGQGNAVDEHGRPEPMDYVIDEEQHALETLSSYTQYLRNLPCESDHGSDAMQTEVAKKDVDVRMRETSVKRAYTLYTDQDKVRFFKLLFEKYLSASAAAKQLGIHVRTAQRWAKQYEKDPDSIFEKRKKNGRPRILSEEHKKVILGYIVENPSAILEQLMERLLQRFEGLKVSKSTVYDFVRTQCNLSRKKARFQPVDRNSEDEIQERLDWVRKWEGTDMDFRTNCVFLDESAFHVNMKRSMAWSKKGSPAVVTVPKTRAQTTTILGAISASAFPQAFPQACAALLLSFLSSGSLNAIHCPACAPTKIWHKLRRFLKAMSKRKALAPTNTKQPAIVPEKVPCPECKRDEQQLYMKDGLRKHRWNVHTPTVWTLLDGQTCAISRDENDAFECPGKGCDQSFCATHHFIEHVKKHGGLATTVETKLKEAKKRAHDTEADSEEEPEDTAVSISRPSDRTFATACDALSLLSSEQENKIMAARIAHVRPIVLTADDQQYHLLTASIHAEELISKQPANVTFSLPVEPVIVEKPDYSTALISDDGLLEQLIRKSALKNTLLQRNFVEMDKGFADFLNNDWRFAPHMRYATPQLFAGAILVSDTSALLLNCPGINVTLLSSDNTQKLVIGTRVSSLLVTSSVTLSKDPIFQVGATTKWFDPNPKTRIYLDTESVDAAYHLASQEEKCQRLYTFDKLAQLRQVRSKFDSISAYLLCRASSAHINNSLARPYTIWTLCDIPTSPATTSQARLASKFFQLIATEVINEPSNPKLHKVDVERLIGNRRPHESPLADAYSLFDKHDTIDIFRNASLNKSMQTLAKGMASALRSANDKQLSLLRTLLLDKT
ncbi:hypothetical protein VTP01DRAFT_10228 [Rhizomucor pusillus]|uniref:uncharacterized protein n=1 Tax=Rhizomucor pusillus TaxID=4840 RepID=UPI00374411E8